MPIYGPYNDYDNNGANSVPYKFFYHPFDGDVLAYAIRLPNNYNPDIAYPIMLWGGGNYTGKHYNETYIVNGTESQGNPYEMTHYPSNPTSGSWPWTYTWLTQNFTDCITIVPRLNDTSNWTKYMPLSEEAGLIETYSLAINGPIWKRNHYAVRDLLDKLIAGTVIPYTTMNSDTLVCDNVSTFAMPKVDATRIYAGGWSGGAITALGYMYTMADMIAGVFACAGQYYFAYQDTLNPESSYYNAFCHEHAKILAKRLAGKPVFVSCANSGMHYENNVMASLIADVCDEYEIENKFWFLGYDSTGHNYTVEAGTPLSSTNKIDTTVHIRQYHNTNPATEINVNPKLLILSKTLDNSDNLNLSEEENSFLIGNSYKSFFSLESLDTVLASVGENSVYIMSNTVFTDVDGSKVTYYRVNQEFLENNFGDVLHTYSRKNDSVGYLRKRWKAIYNNQVEISRPTRYLLTHI